MSNDPTPEAVEAALAFTDAHSSIGGDVYTSAQKLRMHLHHSQQIDNAALGLLARAVRALRKDRDEWKANAEKLDAKCIHEQGEGWKLLEQVRALRTELADVEGKLALVEAENERLKGMLKSCEDACDQNVGEAAQLRAALTQAQASLSTQQEAMDTAVRALEACNKERIFLINGICEAVSQLIKIKDNFFDEDPDEGTMGSPEGAALSGLSAHLQGSLIDDDGEFIERNKYDAALETLRASHVANREAARASQFPENGKDHCYGGVSFCPRCNWMRPNTHECAAPTAKTDGEAKT